MPLPSILWSCRQRSFAAPCALSCVCPFITGLSAGKDEIVAASLSQAVEITQLRRALADISSELDMQKCTIAAVLEAADQNRRCAAPSSDAHSPFRCYTCYPAAS